MILHLPLFNKQTTSIDGITLFFVIIIWVKNPSQRFINHELCHISQIKAQPFSFYPRYFYQMIRNRINGMSWREAYRNISYEVEARKASGQS